MIDRRQASAWLAGGWAVGGAVAAPAAIPPTAAPAWRLATGYSADGFHARNLAAWCQAVARQGGPVIDMPAPNGIAPLAAIPDAVTAGQAELGEVIMTALSGWLPSAGADVVPFLVRGYRDAWRLWQHQRPVMVRGLAARGLRPLMAVPWPGQGLYTRRPVQRLADLAGLRMRTYNDTTVALARGFGAEPVDVPMIEVAAALAEGRIDAMITSAVTGVESRAWAQLNHFMALEAWLPKNLTFVREAALAALPPDQRRAVLDTAPEAERLGWQASEQAAARSLATLREHGMTVDVPGFELRRQLQRLGEHFARDWVRQVGPAANEILVPYYTTA